ncbi:MAG: cysteine--tRNA ligase [Oleiphilus sp.]|nr:MAG: cysteine--tRNA ligase [Oleiphilus sp.]
MVSDNTTLSIYNTLSGKKERFQPIEPNKVRMYVCGMTVYDYCHIGHARVMVGFDVITRFLRHIGYDVTYIRNITDVDDKIFARAAENGEPFEDLTARFIDAMHEDERALSVLPPDQEPRATAHMGQIIAMIETLIEKGYAYAAENGDVYYAIDKFEAYGRLSKKKVEDLQAGARVDVEVQKQNPLDFALWKAAKEGEASWDSPWGKGRPGWHIECSAMSTCCLGDTFDIHGGGPDLKFPHHENEIAQSEGATGKTYVNVWMHAGAVRVNKEKMSKSLGNFFTIREVLEKYSAEVIRYFLISSHYRSQVDYSESSLAEAQSALDRFYQAIRGLEPEDFEGKELSSEYTERFKAAMSDDFNTPEALAVMFELVKALNIARQKEASDQVRILAATLREMGDVLGILQTDPEQYFRGTTTDGMPDAEIEAWILRRKTARENKDWAESDRIRDVLAEQGIVLDDGKGGTTWRRQ